MEILFILILFETTNSTACAYIYVYSEHLFICSGNDRQKLLMVIQNIMF